VNIHIFRTLDWTSRGSGWKVVAKKMQINQFVFLE